MSQGFAYGHNPHSTGHVISTVRTLMRADGLAVPLATIARHCGTSRNFLYANWKTASALHLLALKAELAHAFDMADHKCPSDGTVQGLTEHLTQVVRVIRRHPTSCRRPVLPQGVLGGVHGDREPAAPGRDGTHQ